MQVSSEKYQNPVSVKPDVAETARVSQTEKGTENIRNLTSSSSQDTLEISGQAAKLSRAEMREQAALARIQMLKQQNAAVTESDAPAESGETASEDPLTVFINTMFKMLEERQETQLENAAEQAEKQKEEMDAAMLELEDARAEKQAAQEETTTATGSPVSPEDTAPPQNAGKSGSKAGSGESASDGVPRKDQDQSTTAYGKKGTRVRAGFSDSGNKSSYRATA